MVPSWQWSRRRISAPALQPQSVCAICLYIMQHPDTPVPRDSRVQRSAGATRSTRSAPRRGLGIFNLGLGPALVSLECVRRQSTAARHLVAQHLCLKDAGTGKPPSVPALDCIRTDCRFFSSSSALHKPF